MMVETTQLSVFGKGYCDRIRGYDSFTAAFWQKKENIHKYEDSDIISTIRETGLTPDTEDSERLSYVTRIT